MPPLAFAVDLKARSAHPAGWGSKVLKRAWEQWLQPTALKQI
jgi:hypothetical protein